MGKKYDQEILESIREYLPKLISGIESAVDSLRSQEIRKALEIFPLIMEGLDWVIKAFYNISEYIDNSVLDKSRLVDLTKELLEALENEDYVLLADMFEYEVLEILTTMKDYTETLD